MSPEDYDDEPLSRVEQQFGKQSRLEKQYSKIVVDGLVGDNAIYWSTVHTLEDAILEVIEEGNPLHKELMSRIIKGDNPTEVMNYICSNVEPTFEIDRLLKKLNQLKLKK